MQSPPECAAAERELWTGSAGSAALGYALAHHAHTHTGQLSCSRHSERWPNPSAASSTAEAAQRATRQLCQKFSTPNIYP
eukprot:355792-Chlamydomonas_euryale.AAC.3